MAGELVFRDRVRVIVVYRFDQVGEAMGGFGAHAGEQVLVGVNRERRVCVAESFGHDLDGDAGGDEQAGVGVAQVVKPNVRQAGTGDKSAEELTDRFRVQRFAASVGEHRVARSNAVSIVALAISPSFEDVFGGGVEVDAVSAAPCFDGHFQGSSCDDLSAASDGEAVGVALPVAPAEPGEFTATHPSKRREMQCRVEPQVGGTGQVAAELYGCPCLWSAACARLGAWCLGNESNVGGDELPAGRVTERGATMTWTS